jgi:hypothetical protein
MPTKATAGCGPTFRIVNCNSRTPCVTRDGSTLEYALFHMRGRIDSHMVMRMLIVSI